jgi:uncharacterized Zn-binding protein involved in type VI secretion
LGAVTFTNRTEHVVNNKRAVEATATFSASYATGGDTVSPTALGFRQIDEVHIISGGTAALDSRGVAVAQQGRSIGLGGTASAPTFKAYSGSTAEVANATNLSTVAVRVRIYGS